MQYDNARHYKIINDIFKELQSDRQGLSTEEAVRRLQKYGANKLPEERPDSLVFIILRQFHSMLVYIIIAAMAISFLLGHHSDAVFIAVVLLINAGVGAFQEYKAEKTLIFLKRVIDVRTRAIRDGREIEISAVELVPGDIIKIHAGDKVPVDARLIEAHGLEVNEAVLTGESMPVTKDHLDEKGNMIFAGSLAEQGEAIAIVVATGIETEMGKIAKALRTTEKPATPLQKKLARASRLIGMGILVIIGIIALMGYLRGNLFTEIFIISLALVVSAIPEGLPIIITVILAVGMRRLLAHNALIKKLNVAETLGSTTVICTDKTGTLTYGDMQVSHILTGAQELLFDGKKPNKGLNHNGAESHITALKIALLTTSAFIENPHEELEKWIVRGRPTERALLFAALQAGLEKERVEEDLPLIRRFPFDPELKVSGTLRRKNNNEDVLYVLGSPDTIIAESDFIDIDGEHQSLNSDIFRSLQRKTDALARRGLRILACAHRTYGSPETQNKSISELLHKLTFIGFIAIKDPVREEVKSALRLTNEAGVKTVIVTGDHKYTAVAVAEELGMIIKPDEILEGQDLDNMSKEKLQEYAKSIRLYARVMPHHKIGIVEALRANGEVVAMIGDGVNDAPPLRAADIGVAVGSGTEIAKEASDMIILDGNFHTLVKAIEQGRLIFENIRKVIVYLLADDFSEIFILGFAIIFGLPLPLLPAQILFINIIEDTLPAAALVFSKEKTALLMRQKPRGLKEPIFTQAYFKWLMAIFFIGGSALLSFFPILSSTGNLEFARTFIFALTAIDSLLFVLVVSSLRQPVLRKDIFSNFYLVAALIAGALMISAAIYLPILQKVLDTVPLSPAHWLWIAAISLAELILLELTKYCFLWRKK